MEISPDACSHWALAQQPAAAAHQLWVILLVVSEVLSWEKVKNPFVKVAAVSLLVRWEWVEGKVPVGVGPPVVMWRRIVCPVNVAGLSVLSIGPDIARRRSQLVERQKSNWGGVWDCL